MLQDSVASAAVGDEGAGPARLIEPSFLHALPYYFPLGVFPLIVAAGFFGGWWLLPPWFYFSAAWVFDGLFGLDARNMDPTKTPERRLLWYNLPVWAWGVLWPTTLIFCIWQILMTDQLAIWEGVVLALILTMEGQGVFMIGHELVHRRSTWQRRLGEFLLSSSSYPQYATEHVYIHHAQVGMPSDLGSPRKGENFWRYFPKEVASNLTSSWRVAGEHLARSNLPRWHYKNPFWRYAIYMAFWYGLLYWMGGVLAVLVFAFLGLSCVFSMKIVNYFQHYGLRRVRLANGRWEKIMPRHSWSADWKFSNWMLYNAQRHADHHANATKPYPLLQTLDPNESPQIPGTFADMIRLVTRPKDWFEKMDPLVDQWRKHFYPEIEDWSAYDSSVAAARPEAFDAITEIFAAAPRLAHWIERHPQQLDTLQEREFIDIDLPKGFGPDLETEVIARRGLARLYWTVELGVQEMKEEIAQIPVADARETVEVVRDWSNNKAFQLGMHVIRGNLSAGEARVALSNLAEASISSVLAAVTADLVDWRGPLLDAGFAVILLGDLASREAHPGACVRVLLVQEGLTPREEKRFSGACRQRLIGLTKDSLLFSADAQDPHLCLALPLDELGAHCQDPASDQCPELTRVRCVLESGNAGTGERFLQVRTGILDAWRETGTAHFNLPQAPEETPEPGVSSYLGMRGGLVDIQKAARFKQLGEPETHVTQSAPTAAVLLGKHEPLAQAATLWRDLQGVMRLVGEEGFDADAAGAGVKTVIANACGCDDFDLLSRQVSETASRSAAEFEALVAQG